MRDRRLPTELKKTLDELSIAALKEINRIIAAHQNKSTDSKGGAL